MFIAQIQTAAGPLTIGLTNITLDETNATLSALLEMLSQVSDPIEVVGTDVYVYEAPEGSPAAMSFKYLGPSAEEFDDPAAYARTMNERLSLNVFACAMNMTVGDAGRINVDFASFELIEAQQEDAEEATIH